MTIAMFGISVGENLTDIGNLLLLKWNNMLHSIYQVYRLHWIIPVKYHFVLSLDFLLKFQMGTCIHTYRTKEEICSTYIVQIKWRVCNLWIQSKFAHIILRRHKHLFN